MKSDRDLLAVKLRDADFAVTQFFFDADEYLRLVDDLAERGIEKPVVPGIMPVTSVSSIDRMAAMGSAVPAWMGDRLRAAGNPGDAQAVGVDAATQLCQRLLEAGAPGLHFYTLNRSTATRQIYANLGLDAPIS